MRRLFTILVTVMLTTQIGVAQDNSFKPTYWTILDKSNGEKLLRQCSRSVPKKIKDYWTLTQADVDVLEKHFQKAKSISATDCCLINGTIDSLEKFGFQFIGVTIRNRRYIYINAFQVDNSNDFDTFYKKWKTDPIVMCDGGESYWGILFDIEKKEFTHLAINGVA